MSTNFYLRPIVAEGPWHRPVEVHIGKTVMHGVPMLQGFPSRGQSWDDKNSLTEIGFPDTIATWTQWKTVLRDILAKYSGTVAVFSECGDMWDDAESFITYIESDHTLEQRRAQAERQIAAERDGILGRVDSVFGEDGYLVTFCEFS